MIKRFLSSMLLSRALAQDTTSGSGTPPTGSCPQFCYVNTTVPQVSQTLFQGPVMYKNINYNAKIVPHQSFVLIDSTGRQDTYQYKGWILSDHVLVGQVFSSPIQNIMVGFECNPNGQAFQSFSDSCMDAVLYLNPEYCTVSFQTNMICPSATPNATTLPQRDTMTPTMTSMPTRQMEPSMTAAPTRQMEPSMTAAPTRQMEPSMTSEPTKRTEPSMTSEPTKRTEPSMTAAPTRQMEPSMTSEPTKHTEPSIDPISTNTFEPHPSNNPIPTNEPVGCDGICIKYQPVTTVPVLSTTKYYTQLIDFMTGTTNSYEISWSQQLVVDQKNAYRFDGWILMDNEFVGQRFTGVNGSLFIGFMCNQNNESDTRVTTSSDSSVPTSMILPVHTPCGEYYMFMHQDFCNLQTITTERCDSTEVTPWPTRKPMPSNFPIPSDMPMPSDFPKPSEYPTRLPTDTNHTCDDVHPCILDIAGPNLTISEPIVTGLLSDSTAAQFIISIGSNLTVKSNVTRTFEFSGWVIVDGMFVGQRFSNSMNEHRFIQFNCAQRGFIGLIRVDDPCVPRLALMHPAFCTDMRTDAQCMIPNDMNATALPTRRPEMPSELPTRRPEMPTQLPTPFPTRRPDAPSDKPTPRPTYSALPTRRPTLSSMPTRMFRSPPPKEQAKTLRSQLRIETRNESLFQNPKNVEAVVKTVVCTLNVKPETVQVTGIQHFVDNLLVGIIPVPQTDSSRNYTSECIIDYLNANPTNVPVPSQPPPIEPVAIRRLQSGLDTYVVQYQVQDPPAAVTSLDPATVATMIETTPTLVNSLDIPAGSYVAITAEQPTYAAAEPVVVAQNSSQVTNILMGVLIPVGVLVVASVVAMTLRRRNMPITSGSNAVVMQFAPVVPNKFVSQNEIHPIKLASENANFSQSNPRIKVIRSASKHSVQPMQVRK